MRRAHAVAVLSSLVVSVLLGACRSSGPGTMANDAGPITYPGLEWLTHADPGRDLSTAWECGDQRFVGIHGFTSYTPGVPEEAARFVEANGVRYLVGTSDAIESREHRRAVVRATEYARRYNAALLKKLQ